MGGTIDNELEEIISVRRLRSNIWIFNHRERNKIWHADRKYVNRKQTCIQQIFIYMEEK